MSAQVLISPSGSEQIPYAINVGPEGRTLQEVVNGACMLSGAQFPDIDITQINGLPATDWHHTIKDGDEISVTPKKVEAEAPKEAIAEPKKEDTKKVDGEALAETKTEEKVVVKTVRPEVSLSPVLSELGKLDPHIECLAQDLSILEDRIKKLTDSLSSVRKVLSAAQEHSTQFQTVLEESKKNVQDYETRLNNIP